MVMSPVTYIFYLGELPFSLVGGEGGNNFLKREIGGHRILSGSLLAKLKKSIPLMLLP